MLFRRFIVAAALALALAGCGNGTDFTVHLTATKPDGFPAGSYATQAVVRCE